jgi:hypothetical protein
VTLCGHASRPVKNAIPSAQAPGFITVTDGTLTVGTIVERDGSHFAFNPDGQVIGEYPTRRRAIQALPLRRGRP